MERKLYQAIASKVMARVSCKENNPEWFDKHETAIEKLVADHMPSGSGIDTGTTIDFEKSRADRLVFTCSYHHMNETGYYDGWTDHTVTVIPSLAFGFDLKISGRDRNGIKDYLGDVFQHALSQIVEE
jgi:hypothetical protein